MKRKQLSMAIHGTLAVSLLVGAGQAAAQEAPKAAKETRYEPVSGRVDPELSVRELFPTGTGKILADEK